MGHIHNGLDQHDQTASGYIVRTDGPEPAIMLHKHKKLGILLQFGGHVELKETPWQAVSHELLEESGYELSQLKILQPKWGLRKLTIAVLHPYPVCHNTHKFNEHHFHTDVQYAFITDKPPRHSIAEGESGVIGLYTRKEIIALSSDEIHESTKEVCLFILDVCLTKWVALEPGIFKL